MKIKVLICNCNGLKFAPEDLDMNTLPFDVERDVDIQYAIVHPQLCGKGGLAFLGDLLRGAEPDSYFLIAGCEPKAQQELLGHALVSSSFPPDRFVGVTIRCASSNAEARNAILEAVGRLLVSKNEGSLALDAFGG
jgi:heterodisulfide reductase subunit A-like polyferredoxin